LPCPVNRWADNDSADANNNAANVEQQRASMTARAVAAALRSDLDTAGGVVEKTQLADVEFPPPYPPPLLGVVIEIKLSNNVESHPPCSEQALDRR
jgi:hypothetical protein